MTLRTEQKTASQNTNPLIVDVLKTAFIPYETTDLKVEVKELILDCISRKLAQDFSAVINSMYKINSTVKSLSTRISSKINYSVVIGVNDLNKLISIVKIVEKSFSPGDKSIEIAEDTFSPLVKKHFGVLKFYEYKIESLEEALSSKEMKLITTQLSNSAESRNKDLIIDQQKTTIEYLEQENKMLHLMCEMYSPNASDRHKESDKVNVEEFITNDYVPSNESQEIKADDHSH